MAKKKITQLDPATSVNSDALFPLSQLDNSENKTFKGTIEQLGDYINKSQDFNTLNTTSKKVIGAINEVLANSDKDIISSIDTPAPIMSFNDGGDNIPVNKLLVAVTAQQASGTPTPSSPLAITGWSQAQISVSDGVTPQTVIIPFGDTYYGAVLDVTNGKLTVTHQMDIFDGDVSEGWTLTSDGTVNRRFVLYGISSIKAGTYNQSKTNYLSYVTGTSYDWGTFTLGESTTYGFYIVVHDKSSNFADLATFKTYLSNNNLQLLTEMPTPIEINLTPEQIATLSGLNNIYADCGDIQELEYFNENANEVAELNRAMSDDFHIYSTAEQIVGKWLGEDLYEKSYHYTQATVPSQATAVVIDNAISNLNLASLVDFTCVYKAHHTAQNYDIWYHGGLSNTQLDYNTGNLLFYQKATSQQQNYSNLEVNITIRYTKASS